MRGTDPTKSKWVCLKIYYEIRTYYRNPYQYFSCAYFCLRSIAHLRIAVAERWIVQFIEPVPVCQIFSVATLSEGERSLLCSVRRMRL